MHKSGCCAQTVLESTEEAVNPTDLLTPYDALDDEGNPWWSPPDRDFWEGGAWDVRTLPQLIGRLLSAGCLPAHAVC